MADAIWNNNYLLSNLDAQKLYAQSPLTTGVSGTSAYIGLEPSARYNETVLFENSNPSVSSTWPLADSPNNYDKIEITYNTYNEGNYKNKISTCPCINNFYGIENIFCNSVGNHYYWMFYEFSGNDSQLKLTSGGFRQLDSTASNVSPMVELRIYKIIGINRKEV